MKTVTMTRDQCITMLQSSLMDRGSGVNSWTVGLTDEARYIERWTRPGDLLTIPVLPTIDLDTVRLIDDEVAILNMSSWEEKDGPSCKTAYCRAGFAVYLGGPESRELLNKLGGDYSTVAALIFLVSRPGQNVPNFYNEDIDAMEDMRRCAAEQEKMALDTAPPA